MGEEAAGADEPTPAAAPEEAPAAETKEQTAPTAPPALAEPIFTVRLKVPVDELASVRARFEEHLWPSRLFSTRLEADKLAEQRDESLDAAYHFVEETFGDEAAAEAFVAKTSCAPLDSGRPPWRLFVLRVPAPAEPSVLVRVHSALVAEAMSAELAKLEAAHLPSLAKAGSQKSLDGSAGRAQSRSRSPKRGLAKRVSSAGWQETAKAEAAAMGDIPLEGSGARLMQEIRKLKGIDSNQKGGGGSQLFKAQYAIVLCIARCIPESLRAFPAERLEHMGANFKGSTPGRYRAVCLEIETYLSDNGVAG